jgi:NAD(P)-dependent dehydrogenase (short-subunit alcohol dehydrogenase family)
MDDLQRVAVVTGGNRGIGYESCRQLAQRGSIQVILTSRDAGKGQLAAQELSRNGAAVTSYPLDVASAPSAAQLHDFVLGEVGRVDILVNNAAVLLDEELSVLDTDIEIFRTSMETNTFGPLRLCQAFLPRMIQQDCGRIVNVSTNVSQISSISIHSHEVRRAPNMFLFYFSGSLAVFSSLLYHLNQKLTPRMKSQ